MKNNLKHDFSKGIHLNGGMIASVLATAVSIAAPFLATPTLLNDLGDARFGVWVAATAFFSISFFLDFGVGNALLTRLAAIIKDTNRTRESEIISTAYVFLGCTSFILFIIAACLILAAPPQLIRDQETQAIWLLVAGGVFVGFPTSLLQKVMSAYQREVAFGMWRASSAAVAVLMCFLSASAFDDWRITLATYILSSPLVLILGALLFFRSNEDISPRLSKFNTADIRSILGSGKNYTMLSAILAASAALDNLLIGFFLGSEAVTDYALPSRLPGILPLLLLAACAPLWPAYGYALSMGQRDWVRRNAFRMSICLGLGSLCLGTILAACSGPIIEIWLHRSFPHQFEVIMSLVLLYTVQAFTAPYNMVLNSKDIVSFQSKIWAIYLSLSIAGKIIIVKESETFYLPVYGAIMYLSIISIPVIFYSMRSVLSDRK